MQQAYEIHNPSIPDMTLDQQIAAGINDWLAEGRDGHPYVGQSKEQAEQIRNQFES